MGILTNAGNGFGQTIGGGIGANIGGALGDAAEQSLLQQVRLLKNTVTGNGISSQPDPETLKYYAKVKALGLLYVGQESVAKDAENKRTDVYYKSLPKNTQGPIAKDAENKGIENYYNQLPLYTQAQQQQPEPAQPVSSPYIPTRQAFVPVIDPDKSETMYPFTNVNEKVVNPDPNTYLKEGPALESGSLSSLYTPEELSKVIEDFYLDNNSNHGGSISTPGGTVSQIGIGNNVLPTPGKEVPQHDGSISEAFTNQVEYEITLGNGKKQKLVKSWILPNGKPNEATYGTSEQDYLEKLANTMATKNKSTPGSYRFFIEKLHGKSVDGSWNKKNPIRPGKERSDMPNRMVFPAYISNFNDGYDVDWSSYDFHGRGEAVNIYKGTKRSLTLEFYIMSDFSSELLLDAIKKAEAFQATAGSAASVDGNREKLSKTTLLTPNSSSSEVSEHEKFGELSSKVIMGDWGNGTGGITTYTKGSKTGFVEGQYSGTPEMLWNRVTFLAQCCYGWYRNDGKLKEQPFVRVRIGDFIDCVAKINSLQHTTEDFDMDLNPSTTVGAIPMGIRVSMNMTIVHEDEPSSTYNYFYHRLDRDLEGDSFSPISQKETSSTMDSVLDVNTTKSPANFKSTVTGFAEDKTKMPKETKIGLEAASKLKSSISNLDKSGNNLKDFAKREKIKEVFQNVKNVLNIQKKVDVEDVKNLRPDNKDAFKDVSSVNPATGKKKLFG